LLVSHGPEGSAAPSRGTDATAPLPLLVIIAGPPASGKTTLADRLSDELQLPLVHCDAITEALADIVRPPSRDEMEPIRQASFRAFYTLVAGHLARGTGVVCETNFQRGVAEGELRPIIAHARSVLINCSVDRELSVRRFIERFEWGERHWCYFDEERIDELQAGRGLEAWDRAEPLDLDVPTLTVDTTDGYNPSLNAVVDFVRSSSATVVSSASEKDAETDSHNGTVCPKLGFMDDPPNHYSHPTHLHRCFAGVSPVRLSTQQQRDLCLTEGFIACPRLAGVYGPRVRASVAPARSARPLFETTLAQQRSPELASADEPTRQPELSVPRGVDVGHVAPSTNAEVERPDEIIRSRSERARYMTRLAVAVGGFVVGVTLAAIALLALFSAAGSVPSDDELARVGANPAPHPTTVVRVPIVALPTPDAPGSDVEPSTAGIQQPAPGSALMATVEPTAPPGPPTPAAVAQVRRATVRAPAGFNSAFLREAPATSARALGQLSNGTLIEVLEGSAAGDGFTWARVRTQDGTAGWIVATAVAG
jgi:predicted kinase